MSKIKTSSDLFKYLDRWIPYAYEKWKSTKGGDVEIDYLKRPSLQLSEAGARQKVDGR